MTQYKKYDNELCIGKELYHKYLDDVRIELLEKEYFVVSNGKKQIPCGYHEVGSTVFFSKKEYNISESNDFPTEKYAPFKNAKSINDVSKVIDGLNDDFFDGMSYYDKEYYFEEQHFDKVEAYVSEQLKKARELNQDAHSVGNGNSDSYDPDAAKNQKKYDSLEKEWLAKWKKPYFAKVIEIGGVPVYIGHKAIEGRVIDSRTRKYADILRLKNYQRGKVDLIREFDIQEGYFIDFSDVFNSMNDEVVQADPLLMKILEYNRGQREMVSIAETIRDEQHRIIIRPIDENFIVNGCAGSGKTMILLHRLTSLIFNEADLHAEDLIIISPNEVLDRESRKLAEEFEMEADKIKSMVAAEELKANLETRKAVKVIVESAVAVAPKAKEETEE